MTNFFSAKTSIQISCGVFIVALIVSAAVVPDLRLLHFLQSLIYVSIIFLAQRNSEFGYGAGTTVPLLWNSLNLFVTHLIQQGMTVFVSFIHNGNTNRLDTMMVFVGGVAHTILIISCLTAMFSRKKTKSWKKFLIGGVAATLYLVLIVIIARPK